MTRYLPIVGRGCLLLTLSLTGACAQRYEGVVRRVPKLSALSPELENLTDFTIETYLKADAKPVFPSTLAVAKVVSPNRYYYGSENKQDCELATLRGEEASGWRNMTDVRGAIGQLLIEQVQLVSPLLVSGPVRLKSLRDAAALLHAPLLLVYMQDDSESEGYNDAAMTYWTFIGLFFVPGNTVGHYTTCQGVLIDTRSGFILATVDGEAMREENVLLGAVDIARDRVRREAQAEAIAEFQKNSRETMIALAQLRAAGKE